MKSENIGFETSLLPWLGKTMKLVDGYISSKLQDRNVKLSKIQWILLKILDERGSQVQQDLAFLTERNKASLTRLIHTLESKGYVKRVISKEDKRVNMIHLTVKGKKELDLTMPIVQKLMHTIQKDLTANDHKQVIGVLQKILQNIDEKDHQHIFNKQ